MKNRRCEERVPTGKGGNRRPLVHDRREARCGACTAPGQAAVAVGRVECVWCLRSPGIDGCEHWSLRRLLAALGGSGRWPLRIAVVDRVAPFGAGGRL